MCGYLFVLYVTKRTRLFFRAGFMCSSAYRKLVDEKNSHVELLPTAAVHKHPKTDLQPYYFSDVVIPKEKRWVGARQAAQTHQNLCNFVLKVFDFIQLLDQRVRGSVWVLLGVQR